MLRASATTEEEKVEKKTPRKHAAPNKPAAKAAPKKPATKRKSPAPKQAATTNQTTTRTRRKNPLDQTAVNDGELTEEMEMDTEVKEVTAAVKKRKAPTSFTSESAKSRAVRTQMLVMTTLLIVGVGASAAVGFNDATAGPINVEQTIKAQNARMANMVDVDGPTVVAPTPNRATVPDGGLIASTDQSKRAPVAALVPSASSTATSTDASATSTEDGTNPEAQQPAEAAPANDASAGVMDTATTTVTATSQTETSLSEAESNE